MQKSVYSLNGKTTFNEVEATGYLTPADLKALGIEENVTTGTQWQIYQLPTGQQIVRGHYKPLTGIDDIFKVK